MTAGTENTVRNGTCWARDDLDDTGEGGSRPRLTRTAVTTLLDGKGSVVADLLAMPLRTLRHDARGSDLIKTLDTIDTAFYDVLAPILDGSPELKQRFTQWTLDACRLAAQAIHEQDGTVTADRLIDDGTTLANELIAVTDDNALVTALGDAVRLGDQLRDVPAPELLTRLATLRDLKDPVVLEGGAGTEHIDVHAGIRVVDSPPWLTGSDEILKPAIDVGSLLAEAIRRDKAEKEITRKAAQIGAGAPQGSLRTAGNGYVIRYADYNIYFSEKTGAHELHGDILAKYKAANGIGQLGLPTTDETGTPDGIGRYNHFETGSIYWTPDTGPMIITGMVRARWAAAGWENGPLGYPVADIYHVPGLYPPDNPKVAWSLFQNGAMIATVDGVKEAAAANLSPERLRIMFRKFIDDGVHRAGQNLGLHPQTEIVEVSPWSYGFWAASPRLVTIALHGFRDNGLLPDTDFDITMRLRFSLVWLPAFTAPASKTLVAALDWHRVTANGIASGQIASGVYNGIASAFWRGSADPVHPEVPDGAVFIASIPTGIDQTGNGNVDVIDVLTTPQGGLQVLVNPLPPFIGEFRRQQAQRAIDNLG
ncbi:LGFP repeat-containing protein [Mycobacterium sp. BK086]|nr:LGFP repeat-containing protein [Mycobacterium sp. BK086]